MYERMASSQRHLAIIGGGVSGLTAALVAARNGINVTIFEAKNVGGRVGGIPYIESYPGLDKIKGTEFMKVLKKQLEEYPNIELHELEPVKEIKIDDDGFILITNTQEYNFADVILAMGSEHRLLGAPGETEFKGKGVSYCAACDGLFFRNKNTLVIGNNTHAVEQALFLNELGSDVTLITLEQELKAEPKLVSDLENTHINVMYETKVSAIFGERLVAGAKVVGQDSQQQEQELEAKGIFISVGLSPRTDLVKDLGVELTAEGYIKTNERFLTNIPNLYAIGDLTSTGLEVVTLCASGVDAVKGIYLS